MVVFESPRTINYMMGQPQVGSYAQDASPLVWQRCREQFAGKFIASTDGFYFSIDPDSNQAENVAAFILKTEEILNIDEYNTPFSLVDMSGNEHTMPKDIVPTRFAKTNRRYAIWVMPSKFWKQCQIKRSLFTILLRCGTIYNPESNNYEEALYSHHYIRETEDAIKRFLFGFTQFMIDKSLPVSPEVYHYGRGWVSTFKSKSREQIRKQLVLPCGIRRESSIVGLNSLWM